MTLQEFKQDSRTEIYDNKPNARKEWSKTYGLSWWRSLWQYKQYTLGKLVYRTGQVYTRHTHYSVTEFEYNGEAISKKAFLAKLSEMVYKPKEVVRKMVAPTPQSTQMTLF